MELVTCPHVMAWTIGAPTMAMHIKTTHAIMLLNYGSQLQLRLQYCCCGTFHNCIAAAVTATLSIFSCNFLHRNAIATAI